MVGDADNREQVYSTTVSNNAERRPMHPHFEMVSITPAHTHMHMRAHTVRDFSSVHLKLLNVIFVFFCEHVSLLLSDLFLSSDVVKKCRLISPLSSLIQ